MEIIIVTEGDSESAKAIGIRRAKGKIIGMFCADNMIMEDELFLKVAKWWKRGEKAIFPAWYHYNPRDNSLNRYFSLIGGNDPICWWLGKNDRFPHVESAWRYSDYLPSYGCNGFFYDAKVIKATDLDHYYPPDNFADTKLPKAFSLESSAIWHRTSDNLFTFLTKRYKYARDLYCDRKDRRWKMVHGAKDIWGLVCFTFATLTIAQPLYVSLQGYKQIRDKAWFWHLPVCWGFLATYGALTIRWLLTALLSLLWGGLKVLGTALKACGLRVTKTLKSSQ